MISLREPSDWSAEELTHNFQVKYLEQILTSS